jgi:DNA-binding PadR family transcriptional regulator
MPVSDTVPSGRRLRILQLLLEHQELTGGELLELDASLPGGTIYTSLHRLERDKLVTSRLGNQKGLPGPPRRFYKITAHGKRLARLGEINDAVMSGRRVVLVPGGQL